MIKLQEGVYIQIQLNALVLNKSKYSTCAFIPLQPILGDEKILNVIKFFILV